MCKLKKSLNGLKKFACQWYKKFNMFMFAQKFTRSIVEIDKVKA